MHKYAEHQINVFVFFLSLSFPLSKNQSINKNLEKEWKQKNNKNKAMNETHFKPEGNEVQSSPRYPQSCILAQSKGARQPGKRWRPVGIHLTPSFQAISPMRGHQCGELPSRPCVWSFPQVPDCGDGEGQAERSQAEGLKCRQDPTLNRKHVFSPSTHGTSRETCLGQPWRYHGAVLRTPEQPECNGTWK